jgi:hypothetical protein
MATMERERPPVVLSTQQEKSRKRLLGDAWAANAARALWAAGIIYLIGSVADMVLGLIVGADWGNPAWEFATTSGSAEGTPRIVLAIALIWVAMYIRGSSSLAAYRLFSLLLIAVGALSAVLGAIATSDYFILRPMMDASALPAATNVLLKTLTLSTLQVVLLIPVGVLGVRRPRA